jgi:hypothetical protein
MSLYLCVFDGDDEVEGVDVGAYSDFDFFRSTVTELLEQGRTGSKYPALILHADSDGEWSSSECQTLKRELADISDQLRQLPSIQFQAEWQQHVGKSLGLKPRCLYESFIDVDGEPLLERMQGLCEVAIQRNLPILFQ